MHLRVNPNTAIRAGFLLFAACASTARAEPPPVAQPADLVMFHGRVLTVDPADSIAQAIAVRGGKIIAVGADRDILRLAGLTTRRIDLRGRTATPGSSTATHMSPTAVSRSFIT